MRFQSLLSKLASGIFVAAAAFIAQSAFATNHVVQVGGTTDDGGYYGGSTANLSFSPSSLPINVGDTVTFQNLGGAPHNVHADDNSFRCANGCDGDGDGGNGAPSANTWSDTITFNTAGTVNYHCDEHQAMGMVGSIIVNAVAPPPGKPITSATSGAWYNTEQSGSGFAIEILPNNVFLAVWFVFTPDGSAQNWLYVQGTYTTGSNTITVAPVTGNNRSGVLLNTGAAFPPNFDATDITTTQWGTMTFTFNDCNSGTVAWNSPLPGYGSGTMAISRLTGLAGLTCQ